MYSNYRLHKHEKLLEVVLSKNHIEAKVLKQVLYTHQVLFSELLCETLMTKGK